MLRRGEQAFLSDNFKRLGQQITLWLGEKTPENDRLVLLLIARLVWDWKSYEKLLSGKENKELEFQVCRMDICHYNFPKNTDLLLQGIGELKPVKAFEGCGSFNANIKTVVEQEFSTLNDLLKSKIRVNQPDEHELLKAWLIACIAKTIKGILINILNSIIRYFFILTSPFRLLLVAILFYKN